MNFFFFSVLLITILASLFLLSKTQNVEIRCDFVVLFEYTCQAHNFLVSRNYTQNIVIIGNHLPNKTNADVINIQTFDQPLPFVITEFFNIFPKVSLEDFIQFKREPFDKHTTWKHCLFLIAHLERYQLMQWKEHQS